jgi:hypothetical protein
VSVLLVDVVQGDGLHFGFSVTLVVVCTGTGIKDVSEGGDFQILEYLLEVLIALNDVSSLWLQPAAPK